MLLCCNHNNRLPRMMCNGSDVSGVRSHAVRFRSGRLRHESAIASEAFSAGHRARITFGIRHMHHDLPLPSCVRVPALLHPVPSPPHAACQRGQLRHRPTAAPTQTWPSARTIKQLQPDHQSEQIRNTSASQPCTITCTSHTRRLPMHTMAVQSCTWLTMGMPPGHTCQSCSA
jgi:hypothetical protein